MFNVNEYFDGKVKSIAFDTATLPATVGVMKSGEYEFSTAKKEYMTVISGQLSVLLPEATTWSNFEAGETFEVPANSRFQVKASPDTAYLCLYE